MFLKISELLNPDFEVKNWRRSTSSQPLTGFGGQKEVFLASFHVLSPAERGAVGKVSSQMCVVFVCGAGGTRMNIENKSSNHLMDCNVKTYPCLLHFTYLPSVSVCVALGGGAMLVCQSSCLV